MTPVPLSLRVRSRGGFGDLALADGNLRKITNVLGGASENRLLCQSADTLWIVRWQVHQRLRLRERHDLLQCPASDFHVGAYSVYFSVQQKALRIAGVPCKKKRR